MGRPKWKPWAWVKPSFEQTSASPGVSMPSATVFIRRSRAMPISEVRSRRFEVGAWSIPATKRMSNLR